MISAPQAVKKLGIPLDVWTLIAQFISPIDLFYFMNTTKLFNAAGSQASVLKPICEKLYQRLCQLDRSLATTLSENDFVNEYKRAFEKVKKSQEAQLCELREQHAPIVAKHLIPAQLISLSPLQRLEAIHKILDEIYIETLDMQLPHLYLIMPRVVVALPQFDYASDHDDTASRSVEDPESESESEPELEIEHNDVAKLWKRRR